jgi:hypothetical protein
MNGMLDINSPNRVLTPDETPAVSSGEITFERKVIDEPKLISVQSWLSYAGTLLQGVAAVFALLYLLGAVAFGAALLFYTLSR